MSDEQKAALNTDRELWREPTDRVGHEAYMPSVHVTEAGGIGINVGGMVYVRPLREWHAAMRLVDRLIEHKVTHFAFGRTADEQIGEVARRAMQDFVAALQPRPTPASVPEDSASGEP